MWERGQKCGFCSHDTQFSQYHLLKSLLMMPLLTPLSEMAAPSALGVVSGLSLCSVARTTASIIVTQSLSLSRMSWSRGVSVPTLFFFSLAILCSLHFLMKEEPFISFCEKAWWELVGNPESVGVLPACGPEWARFSRSVFFCCEKLAQFSAYSSCTSYVQHVFQSILFFSLRF